MTGIVVVLPKIEEGKAIRGLLVRNGYEVQGVCSSGAQALGMMDNLDDGIVISGYKLTDMMYEELYDCLPEHFEMLLLASIYFCENSLPSASLTNASFSISKMAS